MGNICVTNLDTIVNPMKLLNLTTSPSVLRNNISMGTGTGSNLNMTIRVIAGPADSLNLIDISAYVVSLNIFADISALVDANAFLHFPLGDILISTVGLPPCAQCSSTAVALPWTLQLAEACRLKISARPYHPLHCSRNAFRAKPREPNCCHNYCKCLQMSVLSALLEVEFRPFSKQFQ